MGFPTDPLFTEVGRISGLATICEIKIRIFADNNPTLTHLAHAQRLEDVENGIIKAFGKHLSADEIKRLQTGRVIRNKVLHGNFEAATVKLSEIEGDRMTKPSGLVVNLKTGESRDIGSKPISSSSIFEWLLVVASNDFIPLATEVFQKNIATIERLLDQAAKQEIEPDPL